MNKTRPKQLAVRVSEEEYIKVMKKVEKSGKSQQEYFLKAILDKPIVNTDGLKELIPDIKRLGNNLNQLTKKANEGFVVGGEELVQLREELNEVWQLLRQYIQKQA